jgi:hypothetical protein
MASQYRCGSEERRRLVLASPLVNGIDHLVVEPDQATLRVHFLHDLPGTTAAAIPPVPAPALTTANVVIDGGTRFPDLRVAKVVAAGRVLTVTVDRPGDFSEYRLRLRVPDSGDETPDGFDPQLAAVRFTFKVDCPTGFDCRTAQDCPPEELDEPEIDYLARDYASFRQLMLDRMTVQMPGWRERNPADLEMALVELLAYVGDRLSYFQDAVATEAYLGTARRRASVRRHARLLDYRMHDGANARTWLHVAVTPGTTVTVPAGTRILSRSATEPGAVVATVALEQVLETETPIVFETQAPLEARGAHNEILFHEWSEAGCCLPAGATRATLQNEAGALALRRGDLLLLEAVRGASGEPVDADPAHRQVVRLTRVVTMRTAGGTAVPLTDPVTSTRIVEVEWDPRDRLIFPLCLSAVADDGTTVLRDLAVARGNIVPADHGLTTPVGLRPAEVPAGRPWRPMLDGGPVSCTDPWAGAGPVAGALEHDPAGALPWIRLRGDGATWRPQRDLLASDRFATELVAEIDAAGIAELRFGDGVAGRAPSERSSFTALARLGNGTAGNVGPDSLTRIVTDDGDVLGARNPIAASGGVEPELADKVRLVAPRAFRRQERAVTEADYAAVATRRPDVGRAAGRIRWTGSWYTAVVTADRPGGEAVDEPFRAGLIDWLDLFRMAGVDLDVGRPVDVPLDIELEVCVTPDHLASHVKRAVLDVLSRRRLASGEQGLFHPDHWTFGQPLYLSQLYQAVLRIDGISWVDARRFQRLGRAANRELEEGVVRVAPLEIVRLDNDPNFQENGQLTVVMRGGR